MKLNFVTVDVFTDRQFGGNPLAVVTNANGLSTERMQAIAAEFNLAETTFVLPPKDPAHAAQVRIFTPRAEMPFAGHPSIGTAYVLARAGESYGRRISGDRQVFEMIAGLVEIGVVKENGHVVAARLTAPQPLSFGEEIPIETVAAACSLKPGDFKIDTHLPRMASCGAAFLLRSLPRARRWLPPRRGPRCSRAIFRAAAPPACISMFRRVKEASSRAATSRPGCSRPGTASPKTPRPAPPRSP